jgi:hypothetical protein
MQDERMKTSSFVVGGLAGAALGAFFLRRSGGGSTGRAISAALRERRLGADEVHQPSATAIAAEAMRTGVAPHSAYSDGAEIPQEEERLRMGDPDVHTLDAAYVGDEVAGGDMPTPDQDRVDDIGRAYGVSELDSGELRTSAEILTRRDRRR